MARTAPKVYTPHVFVEIEDETLSCDVRDLHDSINYCHMVSAMIAPTTSPSACLSAFAARARELLVCAITSSMSQPAIAARGVLLLSMSPRDQGLMQGHDASPGPVCQG